MPKYQKIAILVLTVIILLLTGSVLYLFYHGVSPARDNGDAPTIACIYQNGLLLQEIDLSSVSETYQIAINGDNDCTNVVEVRKGSIGIVSADCPDKICIHQGFIENTLLPITCLPNRLVIQLTERTSPSTDEEPALDIMTH